MRYQSSDEDSGRWDGFPFRQGDIVISTRSKSGTTWMQMICALLVFHTPDLPAPLATLSPWLDWLIRPRDEVVADLEAQRHRRFIKTHTPLDGIPIDPRAAYIVVARHPLDMAVSLFHQGDNLNRERMAELLNAGDLEADKPAPQTATRPAGRHRAAEPTEMDHVPTGPPGRPAKQAPQAAPTKQPPPASTGQPLPAGPTGQVPPPASTEQAPQAAIAEPAPPAAPTGQLPPAVPAEQAPPALTVRMPLTSLTEQTPPAAPTKQTPPAAPTEQTPPAAPTEHVPQEGSASRSSPATHDPTTQDQATQDQATQGKAAQLGPAAASTVRDSLLRWIDRDAKPANAMDSLPGVMWHLSDAWRRRHDRNILLVHYADLVDNLEGEMRRIAECLDITVPEEKWPALVKAAGFAEMRRNAANLVPDPAGIMKDRSAFFRRGSSGAGRELLTDIEFAHYQERAAAMAPADLLEWLHR